MSSRLSAYIALLAVSIIWGVAGPIIKYTLNFVDPTIFLVYRFGITAIIVFVIFFLRPFSIKSKAIIPTLLYGFLATTLALGLLFAGFDKTSSFAGTIIASSAPIFVSIAGKIFLREHITYREKLGIVLATIGTFITVLEPLTQGPSHNPLGSFQGNLLVIGYVLAFVASTLLAKVILRQKLTTPRDLSYISFVVGFVTFLPIALWQYKLDQIISTILVLPFTAHLGVLFMTVVSGLIAYTLFHKGEKTLEIGNSSIFLYLEPIWALPLSYFWLKETIGPVLLTGIAIIAAGVLVAQSPKAKPR